MRYIWFRPFFFLCVCVIYAYKNIPHYDILFGASVILMFKIDYLASSYYCVASFCDIFALRIYLNFISNISAHYFFLLIQNSKTCVTFLLQQHARFP